MDDFSPKVLIATCQNGEKVAINLGLLRIVFPQRFVRDEVFVNLLNEKKRRGYDIPFKYPDHAPYMQLKTSLEVDQKIILVEEWEVQVCIVNGDIFFQKADLIHVYD